MSPKRLPYPGLRAFTRDESDLFFGRDGCIDAMVDRLAATRFLAVLGASGSGKSSLVRTGLLDALDLGLHPWAGSRWTVADLHPGGQPVRNLAAALLAAASGGPASDRDISLLADFLRRGPRSIAEWVSGGNIPPQTNLLILVDQFEELFRYGNYARQEEAEAFVSLLLETAATPSGKIHIVVTMRSEFLGACALIPGLAEQINVGLYLTPRMTREECGEAIEGPAGVIGFTVERALVNRLLNDLASFAPWEAGDVVDQTERLARRADQLPLMQHVLNRLWARADEESRGAEVILRLADYDGLGGLSGAIDIHGREIMAELGESLASSVEPVFRSLVTGSSVALAVRRPSLLGELSDVAGSPDAAIQIVRAFSAPDCNFLRTSEPSLSNSDVIVDISHESLIRQWTRLREWLANEAKASVAWARLLAAEERYSKGEGGLLTGLDLAGLIGWWETASPTAAWAARHGGKFEAVQNFLELSRKAEAAHEDSERRRQLRERNRLWFGIAGLASALVLAVGLGAVAYFRHKDAQRDNLQLTQTNSELQTQSEKARSAEKKAYEQLMAANKAKDEAQAAQQKADAMLKKANEAEGRVHQVVETVHSGKFKNVAEMQSAIDRITPQSTQKDLKLTLTSNAIRDPGPKERDKDQSNLGRELNAARKKYAQSQTADNLSLLRTAADRSYESLVKSNRQAEADALQKELAADAEKLVKRKPEVASYRIAWDILTDQGDHLKSDNHAEARKIFTRALQLAELLPADDLYKRLVSYERMGDTELADKNIEQAAQWFTKEVAAARQIELLEATSGNLSSLKIAIDRLRKVDVTLKQQSAADALEKELVDDAEALIRKSPNDASYRVAWDILTDQGYQLIKTEPAKAKAAFTRSVDLAELLPGDNGPDLYRRLYSYERLGDLDADNDQKSRLWFKKAFDAAMKRYSLDKTAENLESLRISTDLLYKIDVKLNLQAEADAVQKDLAADADSLLRKTRSVEVYRVAWRIAMNNGIRAESREQTEARKAFSQAMELAELLPDDNDDDLYKKVVSYERLGDQDVQMGLHEIARVWFSKEVDADRKRYALAATSDNLKSLRMSANRLYSAEIKVNRDTEAAALQRELVENAEALLRKVQDAEAYRAAWDVLTDQGYNLRDTDGPAARAAFARSAEVAELLPSDNANDLYRRSYSYERLGDQDFNKKEIEKAAAWYAKATDYAQKRFNLETTAGNLKNIRNATASLCQAEVKLRRLSDVTTQQQNLVDDAEKLMTQSQSGAALEEAIRSYTGAADLVYGTDPSRGLRYLVRAEELSKKSELNTPDGAYARYITLDLIAGSLLGKGDVAEVKAMYGQSESALETYLAFRTAKPPGIAENDKRTLWELYGSLSYIDLLAGNFSRSIEAAQQGLELEPGAGWIEANLAHALLLSGKQAEAEEHYMKVRKGDSILKETAEDFGVMRKLGFTHPAMDAILKEMAQ